MPEDENGFSAPLDEYLAPTYASVLDDVVTEMVAQIRATTTPRTRPEPSAIERTFLARTNVALGLLNAGRDKSSRLPIPRKMPYGVIARFMLELYPIVAVVTTDSDVNADASERDSDLLCLYRYDGPNKGTYVSSAAPIRRLARAFRGLDDMGMTEMNEVERILRDEAPRVPVCRDPRYVPVGNGIFDYEAQRLLPFTPDLVFLTKTAHDMPVDGEVLDSPVFTNDDGSQWEFLSWLRVTFGVEDADVPTLLLQVACSTLRPNTPFNRAVFLYSPQGRNGKGTFVEMLRHLVGPSNAISIPIAAWGEPYALEHLPGKLAVLVDENDVGSFAGKSATFKSAITGDSLTIQRKYKTPLEFSFRGTQVQCVNELVRLKDNSDSLFRRMLWVKCPTNISAEGENVRIKKEYVVDRDVLRFVQWYVLTQLPKFDTYLTPQSSVSLLADVKTENSTSLQWFEEMEQLFVWNFIPREFMYLCYAGWMRETNPSGRAVSSRQFYAEIRNHLKDSTEWDTSGWDDVVRVNVQQDMSNVELLLRDYGIKKYAQETYTGFEEKKRWATRCPARTRGIRRKAPVAQLGLTRDEMEI